MIPLVALAMFAAGFLLAWSFNRLALIPWRRARASHWTERARLLWPAQVSCGVNTFIIPVNLYLGCVIFHPEWAWLWLPFGFAGWCGVILGNFSYVRQIFPGTNLRSYLRQVGITWILQFGVWFVFLGAIWAMPVEFGWRTVAVTAGVLFFHLWLHFGLGVRLLQKLKLFRPANDRLQRIVSVTSGRMNIPVRRVWMHEGLRADAYAMPFVRELIFGSRTLQICTDDEVAAICAHELGHLAESRAARVARFIGSLAAYPLIYLTPALNLFGLPAVALLLIPMVLLAVFARKLSLRLEKRADQMAKDHQSEAGVYARALEKLYRENQTPAVMPKNRRTHPHLYDRMMAAGVTPDYPRPAVPGRQAWTSILLWICWGMLIMFVASRAAQPPPSETSSYRTAHAE